MRLFALTAALLLSACATTPNIRTEFDPGANFAAYRTYRWIPVEVPRGMSPFLFRRVQASIDRSLAARGYTQAAKGDFAIAFTILEDQHTEVHSFGNYGGYGGWGSGGGWGYGWRSRYGSRWGYGSPWGWGGGYGGHVSSNQVYEHSLVIDIYDERSRQAVWHAVARKNTYSETINYTKIDQSVDLVLAKFPPQFEPAARQRRG